MMSYVITVAGIFTATLIPVFAALYFFANLGRSLSRYAAMLGVGLSFWFFFDTMGDAAELDVNEAINAFGGITHFALISAFLAGMLALAIFDRMATHTPKTSRDSERNETLDQQSRYFFFIPVGVAAVMGIHGLGEAWDFGAAASQAPTQSLTDAFGGVYPLVSYPLHKFLEAAIFGALYLAYARTFNMRTFNWHVPLLGFLFSVPPLIGASLGYYVSLDTTYFFAFGVTAALYASLRLSETIFVPDGTTPRSLGSRMFLAITLGFFLLYAAALFH